MYYECNVRLSEDSLKEFLQNFGGYSEEEIDTMTSYELQSQAREAIDGTMSEFFSDYYVIDKDTIYVGDFDS